jgi:hypothetical protein
VWLTFLTIVVVYALVATALVLVLRSMSRRFRADAGAPPDHSVPYGPRGPVEAPPSESPDGPDREVPVG